MFFIELGVYPYLEDMIVKGMPEETLQKNFHR